MDVTELLDDSAAIAARVDRRLGGYDILELGLYVASFLYNALDEACTRELLLEMAEKLA